MSLGTLCFTLNCIIKHLLWSVWWSTPPVWWFQWRSGSVDYAHLFKPLSLVESLVKPVHVVVLMNALTSGSFPYLCHISLYFKK